MEQISISHFLSHNQMIQFNTGLINIKVLETLFLLERIRYGIQMLNPTHVHQMIDPGNLSKTHKLLGTMDTQNDLDNTFKIFNEWSPRGEANNIIGQLCLNHTSMSVGDVIVQGITGNVYMVDIRGFRQLKTDLDKKRKCNSCGRKKSKDIMLYKCKGCKKKYYCSRKCQKYGWSRGQHRIDCTRVSNH
eukprot:941062_1